MIIPNQALRLAEDLLGMAHQSAAQVCVSVDPASLTYRKVERFDREAPVLTGHGSGADLAAMICSFHHWGEEILLYLLNEDGLTQFWVGSTDD